MERRNPSRKTIFSGANGDRDSFFLFRTTSRIGNLIVYPIDPYNLLRI